MSEQDTRQSAFNVLQKIYQEDKHLSYGERVILQSIGAIGMEIVGYIRAYSGETTEDPQPFGDDGVQSAQTVGSEETEEMVAALDNDNGDESTV
tara:strand:- start:763 stop:1044 length:282 start_codon:yes stop_codon:yes gene_type:complete